MRENDGSPLDKIGGLLAFQVVYDLLILGTQSLHYKVTLQAGRAEGMTTLRVDWVHQRLSANLRRGQLHLFNDEKCPLCNRLGGTIRILRYTEPQEGVRDKRCSHLRNDSLSSGTQDKEPTFGMSSRSVKVKRCVVKIKICRSFF